MSEENTIVGKTEEVKTEEIPSLPKRPQSPFAKLKTELTEAFPNLEEKLITSILILSKGELDPCFNALLYYNDPSSISEDELKAMFKPQLPKRNPQLEKDEMMAKKLAKKYSKQERYNNYLLENDGEDDKDSFEKFMEEDLPQIKQQFNKNVEEASTKISNWFGTLNKKFNENANTQTPLFSAIGGGSQQQLLNQQQLGSKPRVSSSSSIPSSRSRYDYDTESIVNQTNGITLDDNTNEDIYGTPKKKQSFEETPSSEHGGKKINVVKPEPIEMEINTGATKASNTREPDLKKTKTKDEEEDLKKDDDDFLVDDSDEDN